MSDGRARHVAEIERLVADTLGPDGDAVFVELAYAAVLGRPADRPALEAATAALACGALSRHQLVNDLLASDELAEGALVHDLTAAARREGRPFDPYGPGIGPATSERVVEVPWALSRYGGGRRALDIGYANAPPAYLRLLVGLGVPELHGADLAPRRVPTMLRSTADVRQLPYRDERFDLVLCISTLEHVGHDNTRYGLSAERRGGDVDALREMARVLAPAGRLLVTVPVGREEHFGWFMQYSMEGWRRLLAATPLETEEEALYRLGPDGWAREHDMAAVAGDRYGDGCPGARAVLCAALVRERGF